MPAWIYLLQDMHGLIGNLIASGSKSQRALQRIYSLDDGTAESVAALPDIHLFSSNGTGTVSVLDTHNHQRVCGFMHL